jgi:hypothetical protein
MRCILTREHGSIPVKPLKKSRGRDVRRQVLLISKDALNSVVRHGDVFGVCDLLAVKNGEVLFQFANND